MHIGDSYQASVCHKAYSEMVSNDLLGPLCVLLLASLSESNNLVSSNYLTLPGAYFFSKLDSSVCSFLKFISENK